MIPPKDALFISFTTKNKEEFIRAVSILIKTYPPIDWEPTQLLIKNIRIKLDATVIYHRVQEHFEYPFFSYSSERTSFVLDNGESHRVFEYPPTKLIKYHNK